MECGWTLPPEGIVGDPNFAEELEKLRTRGTGQEKAQADYQTKVDEYGQQRIVKDLFL